MIPNTAVNADMVASKAGHWPRIAAVNDHILGGMPSLYKVNSTTDRGVLLPVQPTPSKTETYFIAAEEVDWDYLSVARIIANVDSLIQPQLCLNILGRWACVHRGVGECGKVRATLSTRCKFPNSQKAQSTHIWASLGLDPCQGWRAHQSCVQEQGIIPLLNAPPRCCIC